MKIRSLALAAALTLAVAAPAAAGGGAMRVQNAIWNDGHLYGTVATPTSFVAPPEHSTDVIYSFSMSGLTGQRSIAEAAPGDTDFNGGRWSVVMAVFTPEGIAALGDGDGGIATELTSDADLFDQVDLGYVELIPTGFYFECPMLP
jgi:hypothetical protein